MINIASIVTGVLTPLTSIYEKRQDRMAAKTSGEQKIAAAQLEGKKAVEFSDAEWEHIVAANAGGTWKDEYITIVITLPLLSIFIGSLVYAFTGDSQLLAGTTEAMKALETVGVNMGDLMTAVVYAAIGLKVLKGK